MMLSCIKYIVIIYNFLFWLIGVAILGTSIFLYVDSLNYVSFDNISELYMTPFLLFIVLGAIMTLVGFMGCCGAIRESSCVLGTYFLLCITMSVACGATIWWSSENSGLLSERLQKGLLKVMKEKYGQGPEGTTESIIDKIQQDFSCCGVKGPQDWATSWYNSPQNQTNHQLIDYGVGRSQSVHQGVNPGNGMYKVPPSCCVKNSDRCEEHRSGVPLRMDDASVQGIHSGGCWTKVHHYVNTQYNLLIMVAAGLIGIQALALLFACCLCCAMGRGEDK